MVRWSRIGAAVSTVVLAGALTLAGTGIAEAASYPAPPPAAVETLPGNAFTSTNMADLAMYDLEMQQGTGLMTKAAPILRAGGSAAVAGEVGFMVGAAGAKMIWMLNSSLFGGSTWDQSMCSLPTVVREGYTMLSLGAGSSSCGVPYVTPNSDQAGTVSAGATVSYGGASATYLGTYKPGTTNYYCYKLTGSNANLAMLSVSGSWLLGNPGTSSSCAGGYGTANALAAVSSFQSALVTARVGGVEVASMPVTRANPTRQGRCQYTFDTGSPTFGSIFTYAENAGMPVSAFQNSCDGASMNFADGRHLTGVNLQTSTDSGASWSNLVTSPVPPEVQTLPDEFPDCFKPGTTCTLTLEKTIGVSGDTVDCFEEPGACVGWTTKTANGTVTTDDDGNQWKCKYGHYAVDLQKCLLYKNAFKTQTSTDTSPGTITNPETGGQMGTGTSTSAAGNPGNTIDPGTDVGTSTNGCMDSWFSTWNPIDWVMTPVKCALKWAFAPRQDVIQSRWNTLRQRWKQTAIGGLATAVGAWSFSSPGTGCGGINVPLSSVFGHGVQDVTILKACAGDPLAGTAQLSSVVIGIASVLGVIMAVTRALGGVVGARGLGDDGGRSP